MNKNPTGTVNFAKAIADETRQKIMDLCCCRYLNVGEIVEGLGVTQPTVSHHLKILKSAGLVDSVRKGKEVYYTLKQDKIFEQCCQLAEDFAPEHPLTLIDKE